MQWLTFISYIYIIYKINGKKDKRTKKYHKNKMPRTQDFSVSNKSGLPLELHFIGAHFNRPDDKIRNVLTHDSQPNRKLRMKDVDQACDDPDNHDSHLLSRSLWNRQSFSLCPWWRSRALDCCGSWNQAPLTGNPSKWGPLNHHLIYETTQLLVWATVFSLHKICTCFAVLLNSCSHVWTIISFSNKP